MQPLIEHPAKQRAQVVRHGAKEHLRLRFKRAHAPPRRIPPAARAVLRAEVRVHPRARVRHRIKRLRLGEERVQRDIGELARAAKAAQHGGQFRLVAEDEQVALQRRAGADIANGGCIVRGEAGAEVRAAVARPLVMRAEDIGHHLRGDGAVRPDAEGHALLLDAPRAIQRDAQAVFLAHDVARTEELVLRLIRPGEIEIGKIAVFRGRVPAAGDGVGHHVRGVELLGVIGQPVQVEVVGHDGDGVVRHARAHIVAAARQLEHEGLVPVGDGVGAAGGRVAPFVDQLHQDARAVAGGLGALGQRAAQVEGDAAVLDAIRVLHALAGGAHAVGDDDHAALVDKAVRVGEPHHVLAVFHPVIAQRVGDLREKGAPLLGGHDRALFPIARGNPAVAHDDVAAVVLVVADEHMPRRAGGFARNQGHAVHGGVTKCVQIERGRIRHRFILRNSCVNPQTALIVASRAAAVNRVRRPRLKTMFLKDFRSIPCYCRALYDTIMETVKRFKGRGRGRRL